MIFKPKQVLELLTKERKASQNILVILFLDSNKKIISIHRLVYIEKPQLNMSDIFIPAFYLAAKYIIVAQIKNRRNTSDKNELPTEDEKIFLQKIKQAGNFLNIPVLDYLIITQKGYYSAYESR